jgi:hypothetical protein
MQPEPKSPRALSAEDQRAFANAILNPPAPSPALLRAVAAYCRLIGKEKEPLSKSKPA